MFQGLGRDTDMWYLAVSLLLISNYYHRNTDIERGIIPDLCLLSYLFDVIMFVYIATLDTHGRCTPQRISQKGQRRRSSNCQNVEIPTTLYRWCFRVSMLRLWVRVTVRSKVKPKTMTLVLVISSLHKGLKSQIKNRLAKTGRTFPMSYVMVIFVFSEFS